MKFPWCLVDKAVNIIFELGLFDKAVNIIFHFKGEVAITYARWSFLATYMELVPRWQGWNNIFWSEVAITYAWATLKSAWLASIKIELGLPSKAVNIVFQGEVAMYLLPKFFPGQLPSELVPVVANIALVSLSQGCKYYPLEMCVPVMYDWKGTEPFG